MTILTISIVLWSQVQNGILLYILLIVYTLQVKVVKDNLKLLQSNVKRIIGIIVGLLKDHVSVNSFSASKKARIKKIIKK